MISTPRRLQILFAIFLLLSEGMYLCLYSGASTGIILFILVSIAASGLYLVLCLLLYYRSSLFPRSVLWWIIVAGVVFRCTLLGVGPIASGDVYRYLWDGKVQVNGYNPYAHAPTDSILNHLHSPMLPKVMDFPHMRTIYPPLAEGVFTASYALFGERPFGIKLFLLLAEIITLLLLPVLLKTLGKPPAYAAFYALCPLPIMQFMIDGHNDALAFPFLLLALLFWYRNRKNASLFALTGSILMKLLPAMIVPLLWREERGRRKFITVLIPIILTGVAYLPYLLWGGSPWESLSAYSARWYFNGLIFDGVLAVVGVNETAHAIMLVLFAGWVIFVTFRNMDLLEKLYWLFLGFFLLSATVHPWYIIWLAILLPFSFHWSGAVFVAIINLANIVVIGYLAHHIWHFPVPLEILEYTPVFLLAGWEMRRTFSGTSVHF